MSYVTTPGQQQFRIDTESGDWLTANRTPDGVFFDSSGLVYLRQADREALIGAAIDQGEQYADWGKQIAAYDAQGDVVLRDQAIRQREEWVDTRMSGLAKRLAGLEG